MTLRGLRTGTPNPTPYRPESIASRTPWPFMAFDLERFQPWFESEGTIVKDDFACTNLPNQIIW